MDLLGRSKKKEESEEDKFEGKSPRKKDFKDLNPKNKRKRKEPKKPWGKKERMLVLFFLVVTAGWSVYLSLSARSWKLPNIPRFKLPQLSIPFFSEQTIVIEGRKEDQAKASEAITKFSKKTDGLSGVYGLYVVKPNTGFSYGLYEHETFQAASLIKLPVMAAMYMEAENGELDLNDKYLLKSGDKIAGSGSLHNKPVGYEITYRNLIRLMGKQSDNTAFNICRKMLGDKKIEDVIVKIGMRNTSLENNTTSPEDVGVFFEELWIGNVVNNTHKEEIIDYLTDTSFENWLAAGIPDEIRVAHKYGREVHVVNDAGYVFANEPFILVILSKGVVEREADEVIPELARGIYSIEVKEIIY